MSVKFCARVAGVGAKQDSVRSAASIAVERKARNIRIVDLVFRLLVVSSCNRTTRLPSERGEINVASGPGMVR